jgi:hypothetical protein
LYARKADPNVRARESGPEEVGATMSGRRKVGARETYFPPFVNERFDGPPYWACTFTALLNGANVGFLGNREPSHAEVRKLARASGDANLSGGSQSSHMISAMRVRYRKSMHLEALPPRRVQERLSTGWAMVAAVTYGALPAHFRRHSPNFKKGHRVTLIGWNGRASWILDPMAREGLNYEGEPIPWSKFEPAWWSGEQLWFAEGMFRRAPEVKVLDKVPDGRWALPGGSRLTARHGKNPRVIMRKVVLAERKSGHFDAIVEVIPKNGPSMGEFIRVSSGGLAGMFIPVGTPKIVIKPRRGSPAAPRKQMAAPKEQQKPAPQSETEEFKRGRKFEYERIKVQLGPVVNLPPEPGKEGG